MKSNLHHTKKNLDVAEQEKENELSLGKVLYIGNERFDDLDEIIARFVEPMATHVNDIINFRKFRHTSVEELSTFFIYLILFFCMSLLIKKKIFFNKKK